VIPTIALPRLGRSIKATARFEMCAKQNNQTNNNLPAGGLQILSSVCAHFNACRIFIIEVVK